MSDGVSSVVHCDCTVVVVTHVAKNKIEYSGEAGREEMVRRSGIEGRSEKGDWMEAGREGVVRRSETGGRSDRRNDNQRQRCQSSRPWWPLPAPTAAESSSQ